MKKTIIATTIAALLASSALPAVAQDAGVDAGVDAGAGVTVETPALDADAGADVNAAASASTDMADDSYGSVMSSIRGSADFDLSAITEEADISIVLLSSLQGDAETEAAALDQELTANADAQAGLQTRIADNSAIMAKLEADGYAAEDVVAVKSKADGSIIVYVDDRG